jgi:hypothetical protein
MTVNFIKELQKQSIQVSISDIAIHDAMSDPRFMKDGSGELIE